MSTFDGLGRTQRAGRVVFQSSSRTRPYSNMTAITRQIVSGPGLMTNVGFQHVGVLCLFADSSFSQPSSSYDWRKFEHDEQEYQTVSILAN